MENTLLRILCYTSKRPSKHKIKNIKHPLNKHYHDTTTIIGTYKLLLRTVRCKLQVTLSSNLLFGDAFQILEKKTKKIEEVRAIGRDPKYDRLRHQQEHPINIEITYSLTKPHRSSSRKELT